MDRYSDTQLHADLQLEGSGRVIKQSPLPGASDDKTRRLHLTLATQAGD
jgi:hypothetical protein